MPTTNDETISGDTTDQSGYRQQVAGTCVCPHCRFQDSLLETLSMCVHPVILLRVVQHVLLALININEGWGRRTSLSGGKLSDKKHLQTKVRIHIQTDAPCH